MKAPKALFVCRECGCTVSNWVGKCPECAQWNTMEEQTIAPTPQVGSVPKRVANVSRLSEIAVGEQIRTKTGMGELDRVLGGGLVDGSVILLSGEPGIGKSTLLLQISDAISLGRRVLYISGEESSAQIKLRASRLGVGGEEVYLASETDLDAIISAVTKLNPDVLIVDSIQTVSSSASRSAAGSIAQVRDCAAAFIALAKESGTAVFLVGHVNKEGGISGPKILEHMVDAVLYFEGDKQHTYRMIRAMKNRYGSTNEIGVFDMTDRGLVEVPNPSEILLHERNVGAGGNCIGCVMEGTRPLITEIQSLVSPTAFPTPRRTADGFDYNRMCLLLAVLEKRLSLRFSANDVYLNIAGGLRFDEPAADLSVAIALISGLLDRPVPRELIAFGEIGLSGEVRSVARTDVRLNEAVRLGFTTILLPKRSLGQVGRSHDGVRVVGISHISEILPYLIKNEK